MYLLYAFHRHPSISLLNQNLLFKSSQEFISNSDVHQIYRQEYYLILNHCKYNQFHELFIFNQAVTDQFYIHRLK